MSCNDSEIQPKDYPIIITKEATEINSTGATLEAEIVLQGKDKITEAGFILTVGTNTIKYSIFNPEFSKIIKLRASHSIRNNERYICKAYISTEKTLVYGKEISFVGMGSEIHSVYEIYPKSGFDGDTIKISGKNFSSILTDNGIYVNNIKAKITSCNDKEIKFIIPNQKEYGEVDIIVEVYSKKVYATEKFKILAHQIDELSDYSSKPGKTIKIFGKNFLTKTENIEVSFGKYKAEILEKTNTMIKVIVPLPYDNLLSNFISKVTITIGLKSYIFQNDFTIEKSWHESAKPITNYAAEIFTYNGKGNIIDGSNGILYEFNPDSDQWNQTTIRKFPFYGFYGSLLVVNNDDIFLVGGGLSMTYPSINLWQYNMKTNKWTQKNSLPFALYTGTYFYVENTCYIITDSGEVWKCNFENETFLRLKDFPAKIENRFISSFIANGNIYVVQFGKTWMYDPLNDTWIPKANNNFTVDYYKVYGKCFSYNNTGWLLNYDTNLYKYDYKTDNWILTSKYPAIFGYYATKSIFVINDKVFIASTTSSYVNGAPLMYFFQE